MKILILILLLTLVRRSLGQIATPRYCHQCEGDMTSDCAFYQVKNGSDFLGSKETLCEGETKECYTSIHDGVIRRGCIGDGYCDTHECQTCESQFCNELNKVTLFCYQCHYLPGYVGYHENCKKKLDKMTPITCAFDYQRKEKAGCYSRLTNQTVDGVIVTYVARGCVWTTLQYSQCEDDDDKSCIICHEDGCNIHDVGSSGKIQPTLAILILLLFSLMNVN